MSLDDPLHILFNPNICWRIIIRCGISLSCWNQDSIAQFKGAMNCKSLRCLVHYNWEIDWLGCILTPRHRLRGSVSHQCRDSVADPIDSQCNHVSGEERGAAVDPHSPSLPVFPLPPRLYQAISSPKNICLSLPQDAIICSVGWNTTYEDAIKETNIRREQCRKRFRKKIACRDIAL